MPLQAINSTEPIPGYRVVERIGAGGYGEVWKAEVPGGLTKALKFVYGYLDEERASRELKALNRVREVRHPFLLSLERIEIVDGQLLIVTELAEKSLKDRFDECQKAGLPGIPRNELLSYLRDTAEVLDFMSEVHSLQHLDIKPENLLLIAGRTKVADFGLVKDIRDATASMMGGLTPLYAPPEVFEGRPSRWSDQYSLAIVFQEMLTGELPFTGTTAVQLARQHLNARPKVQPLPENDRDVVARALEKDPRKRYPNCRALVECLSNRQAARDDAVASVAAADGEATSGKRRKSQTELLTALSGMAAGASRPAMVPRVPEVAEMARLSPFEVAAAAPALTPTLFIGVGRTGARVLHRVQRRLLDRFGDLQQLPAFQLLLFDIDAKELLDSTRKDDHAALNQCQTVCLPLRRPEDYRSDSRELLESISRRWLYNIPRSLKTEGLRPLGHLALVDHAPRVAHTIHDRLTQMTSVESLAASKRASGFELEDPLPRIVVVGSIAGGTGSGMLLDMAYIARQVLGEMGLSDRRVDGVLVHSTNRHPRTQELAQVNAYACLSELNHFAAPGATYPGDRASSLAPREEHAAPYRHVYLVHLGDELSDAEYEKGTDAVAEYLYMDTATNTGRVLDRCRQATDSAGASGLELKIRTYGLRRISCSQESVLSDTAEILCRGLIEQWLSGERRTSLMRESRLMPNLPVESPSPEVPYAARWEHMAKDVAAWLRVDLDPVVEQFLAWAREQLGRDPDQYFQEQIERIKATTGQDYVPGANLAAFLAQLDKLTGSRDAEQEARSADKPLLETVLAEHRKKHAENLAEEIRKWIFEQLEDPGVRLRGVETMVRWFGDRVKEIKSQLEQLESKVELELTQTEKGLAQEQAAEATAKARSNRNKDGSRRSTHSFAQLLLQYARLRFYQSVLASVTLFVQNLKGLLSGLRDELLDLRRELRFLASQFHWPHLPPVGSKDPNIGDDPAVELPGRVTRLLSQRAADLFEQLEQRLESELLAPRGGLRNVLREGGAERNHLPAQFRRIARSTLVAELRTIDVANVAFSGEGAADATKALQEWVESARPRLWECGGASRLILVLPEGSREGGFLDAIRSTFDDEPTVVPSGDGDLVLCYEIERLSLTQAAVRLIDQRADFVECADRLHTRTDIRWACLPDLV